MAYRANSSSDPGIDGDGVEVMAKVQQTRQVEDQDASRGFGAEAAGRADRSDELLAM